MNSTNTVISVDDSMDPVHSTNNPGTDRVRVRSLLLLVRESRRTVGWALAFTVAGTALGLLQPLLTMRLIDRVAAGDPVAALVATLAVLFLGQAAIEALGQYLLDVTGEGVVLRLRRNLIARLMLARIGELDGQRTGDLLSRVGTDTTVLRDMVASSFVQLVTVVLTGLGTAGLMLWIDPVMFVVVIATIALAGLLVTGVMAGIRNATEQALAALGTMTADLERALGSIRTVRAGRAELRETARVGADAEAAYDAGVRSARLGSVVGPAMEIAVNGSFLLVLMIGAVRVSGGTMSVSELVAFLLYATYLVMPLAGLFNAISLIQRGLGSLGRIQQTLNLPVETAPGPAPEAVPEPVPRPASVPEPVPDPTSQPAGSRSPLLELRQVSFSYGERPVLREVSFELPRSGHVAMVGRSGAGKTTIVSLIEKFYDPDAGTILFEGADIGALDHREYRRHIGLVEQHAPLLYGSLRDNLCYADPDTDDAAIREALGMVNLGELVDRLPNGLETGVGERGFKLSGGERQRVAIARALLSRPKLLLLDEPTSQLDPINEMELTRVMRQVAEKCTLLVVAHRMSTVRAADLIVVLEDGQVSSVGTHESLLEHDTFYRKLVSSHLIQAAGDKKAGVH